MKIPLITDLHFGARNDAPALLDAGKKFLHNVYFPYLRENKCEVAICLGDVLDRRKYVNFNTARRLREDFMEPHDALLCQLDVIIGNHDVYYRSTNELCGVEELYISSTLNLNIVKETREIEFADGTKILYVPWINQENYDETMERIAASTARICLGHLELKDFAFDKNTMATDGLDRAIFDKFDFVGSGHYHHQSQQGNIRYLGSHMEFTWADYEDPKGFHVLDTRTLEVEFIENPYTLHEKLHYSEKSIDMKDVVETYDFEALEGKYVKVVVHDREDLVLFDLFMDKVNSSGAADVKTVDDHFNLDEIIPEDIVDETQDTLTIFRSVIATSKTEGIDDDHLDKFITSLYQEAIAVS